MRKKHGNHQTASTQFSFHIFEFQKLMRNKINEQEEKINLGLKREKETANTKESPSRERNNSHR